LEALAKSVKVPGLASTAGISVIFFPKDLIVTNGQKEPDHCEEISVKATAWRYLHVSSEPMFQQLFLKSPLLAHTKKTGSFLATRRER